MTLVEIQFKPMQDLEFRLVPPPQIDERKYVVISPGEAADLYFPPGRKILVPVIEGAQRGDEAKGRATEGIARAIPNIKWVSAEDSTHNAGKGVTTLNEQGQKVRFSLHLCPATLANPDIKNYIGQHTQVTFHTLEEEVLDHHNFTGRTKLGENYHLMLDSYANLSLPINRVDDIVGKPDAMGSTVAGATASYGSVGWKMAPLVEHVLYDPEEFKKLVEKQIVGFEDRLSHDKKFAQLGITNLRTLGAFIQSKELQKLDKRLEVLDNKLSEKEKAFFTHEDPVEYLLGEYQRICDSGFFEIGDTQAVKDAHIDAGEAGILEGVQSVPISGRTKYSRNRTAAGTDYAQTVANANLDPKKVEHPAVLVFKFLNTAVGGYERTMSGFIAPDAISKVIATDPDDGEKISLEKTATMQGFFSEEEISVMYNKVANAFFTAIKEGHSLEHSTVYIPSLDCEMSLSVGYSLMSAVNFGETGETSKRNRTCRLDDEVETGVVYRKVKGAYQVRNAVDRMLEVPEIGIISAYWNHVAYPGYEPGEIIGPGKQLRQEHLTNEHCRPFVYTLARPNSLNAVGTNDLIPGSVLEKNLSNYLTRVLARNTLIAVGDKPGPDGMKWIKEVK